MFSAYSEKIKDTINIQDAYDLEEIFCCPNRQCGAKFTIRSATGKKTKYFGRLPSTPHATGCNFENGDARYSQPNMQTRYSLEDILQGKTRNTNQENQQQDKKTTSSGENILRINTPKRLLKFCLMNPLKTEYLPGIRIDDILLDERNLFANGRFEGVEGIRMLIGETVQSYKSNELRVLLSAVSKYGKRVYLHASAYMDSQYVQYIRKHIISTYGSFEGHRIAICGEWKIDRKYYISCKISNKDNVILKF